MKPEHLYAYRYWKWRVLGGFCVFYCVNYLGRFNFSLIQPQVIEDLGMTAADTGFVNSCMFWGFALGDLVHGRLGERFGYRRVVLVGALATAAFNVAASFGDDVTSLAIPWAWWGSSTPQRGRRASVSSPSGGRAGSGGGPSAGCSPRPASRCCSCGS